MNDLRRMVEEFDRLPPDERAEIEALIAEDIAGTPWRPLMDLDQPDRPTPQQLAYSSQADVLLYGGSAGGGKTDLLLGLALVEHSRSIIFRREHKQLAAIVERAHEIRRTRQGYAAHPEHRFNLSEGRLLRLGGMQHVGDEKGYQGQPHDFYGFDELTQFAESQFRYVTTWNRSTRPGQRCRIIGATNPPDTAEGEWIIRYWAPWLDDQHPNPALPGELRWYVSDESGKDVEVEGPEEVTISGEVVHPRSRTFIPSSVDDNPFLLATGYKATLQALPEPLRSQMLRGDFLAGREDDPWQIIPTAWVVAAQKRWTEAKPRMAMTQMGADIAQGGKAQTVFIARYGEWFDRPIVHEGATTPDSRTTSGLLVGALRDGAPGCIDVIGPGGAVFGHLDGQGLNVVAMDGSKPSEARDRSGKLGFFNKRAEWYWTMRESLDPDNDYPLALPPDATLRSDLCAPRWKMTPRGIQVEAKPDIIKRLGRSPDFGDAAVYANAEIPLRYRMSKRKKRGEVVHEGVAGYSAHAYASR